MNSNESDESNSEVLLEIGLSASATDEERAIVNSAVVRATGLVKRNLMYDPTRATRIEYYPQADYDLMNRYGRWESDGGSAVFRGAGIKHSSYRRGLATRQGLPHLRSSHHPC